MRTAPPPPSMDDLIRPMLVTIGRGSIAATLRAIGVPYLAGANWLNRRRQLPDAYHEQVRAFLARQGD